MTKTNPMSEHLTHIADQVAWLLDTTDLTVNKIFRQIGTSNTIQIRAVFKEKYSNTYAQYRKIKRPNFKIVPAAGIKSKAPASPSAQFANDAELLHLKPGNPDFDGGVMRSMLCAMETTSDTTALLLEILAEVKKLNVHQDELLKPSVDKTVKPVPRKATSEFVGRPNGNPAEEPQSKLKDMMVPAPRSLYEFLHPTKTTDTVETVLLGTAVYPKTVIEFILYRLTHTLTPKSEVIADANLDDEFKFYRDFQLTYGVTTEEYRNLSAVPKNKHDDVRRIKPNLERPTFHLEVYDQMDFIVTDLKHTNATLSDVLARHIPNPNAHNGVLEFTKAFEKIFGYRVNEYRQRNGWGVEDRSPDDVNEEDTTEKAEVMFDVIVSNIAADGSNAPPMTRTYENECGLFTLVVNQTYEYVVNVLVVQGDVDLEDDHILRSKYANEVKEKVEADLRPLYYGEMNIAYLQRTPKETHSSVSQSPAGWAPR